MPSQPLFSTTDPRPHIRYHGPCGGHPILRRKATDAYAAVLRFLTDCTDWDGTWPDNSIEVFPPDNFIPDDPRNHTIREEFVRAFGPPSPGITIQAMDHAGGFDVSSSRTGAKWTVSASQLDWVLQRVLSAPPANRGWPDAVSCTCALSFRLREPGKGRILSGQSLAGSPLGLDTLASGLLLHASSGNTSAIFDLTLPFDAPDAAFFDYITRLRPYLPVRLAKAGFKHYRPNKAKNGYVIRKVSLPTTEQSDM